MAGHNSGAGLRQSAVRPARQSDGSQLRRLTLAPPDSAGNPNTIALYKETDRPGLLSLGPSVFAFHRLATSGDRRFAGRTPRGGSNVLPVSKSLQIGRNIMT